MNYRISILLLALGFCTGLYAQGEIEVTYETDSKGNYSFYCNNSNYCTYVVEIDFSVFNNLKRSIPIPYKTDVRSGRSFLFTLSPADTQKSPSFRYSVRYYKGCKNARIDRDFRYLLPVAPGKVTQPFNLEFFKINESVTEPRDFYSLGFKVAPGDTIFAARRGIVTLVNDTATLKLSEYWFSSDDNFIELFHNDCSFARYQVFRKSLVRAGQEVEAGDAIAIAGGEQYASGPHVRFSVYFLDPQQAATNTGTSAKVQHWAYVPPVFYTKEGANNVLTPGNNYTSEKPVEIITQEMTKGELKKWMKKHPSL
jgi:murein DD-endopeptidase MepM/ murein hydrolase activator NlpD